MSGPGEDTVRVVVHGSEALVLAVSRTIASLRDESRMLCRMRLGGGGDRWFVSSMLTGPALRGVLEMLLASSRPVALLRIGDVEVVEPDLTCLREMVRAAQVRLVVDGATIRIAAPADSD